MLDSIDDIQSTEEHYQAIMKKVYKIRKQHPASFRYYKLMKEVVSKGVNALEEEKQQIEAELVCLKKVKNMLKLEVCKMY